MAGLRIVTAAEEQLSRHPSFKGIHAVWPEFLLHDRVINAHWDDLYERRPEFQFYLFDEDEDIVLAEGNTVPVVWNGTRCQPDQASRCQIGPAHAFAALKRGAQAGPI